MQMYCTSLEPKRGLGQGADLSILTAIKYTLPQAKSLYDIRVHVMSAADITRAMLADFDSMTGRSVFDTTQVDSLDNQTSERNPFGCPCFKSLFAIWSLSSQRFHSYFYLSIVSWQYQKY